jgi:hypothetical protein
MSETQRQRVHLRILALTVIVQHRRHDSMPLATRAK